MAALCSSGLTFLAVLHLSSGYATAGILGSLEVLDLKYYVVSDQYYHTILCLYKISLSTWLRSSILLSAPRLATLSTCNLTT